MSFASVVNQTENATDNKRLIGFVWQNASSRSCLIDLKGVPRRAPTRSCWPPISCHCHTATRYGKGTRNYTEGVSVF
jgi:hypothetical protein